MAVDGESNEWPVLIADESGRSRLGRISSSFRRRVNVYFAPDTDHWGNIGVNVRR